MPGTERDSRDSANYSLIGGDYIDNLEAKNARETESHSLNLLDICKRAAKSCSNEPAEPESPVAKGYSPPLAPPPYATLGEETVSSWRRQPRPQLYANPEDAVAHVSQERADNAMKELQRRVVESETERWSKIFEAGKCLAGLTAVKVWAPGFTPAPKIPTLIEMQKTPGIDYINVGKVTQAELMKAERLKYSGSCVGGLAVGWGVSHLIDNTLFHGQQYKEGALLGDAVGIFCGIAAPGWKVKAAAVVASHVSGKLMDSFANVQANWNKRK